MKKNYFFNDHKVMGFTIAILILLIGFISLKTLPIEQYPDIAPPTVNIQASYTGADPASIMNSVIIPLEEAVNGVEHMTYMTSTASADGSAEINVYFDQGTDSDMATVNVQNRVSKAMGLLPTEVTTLGVTVAKRQNSILQIGALVSTDDKFDCDFINNYLDINVAPKLKRINGIGEVKNLGNQYSLRIWMKPDVMAQYGLVPQDIFAAVGTQNLIAPTGSLGESSGNTYQYSMEYRGRLKSVEEFENIVLHSDANGNTLLLKDVADVEIGAIAYTFTSSLDNHPAVLFIINQSSGANATLVNQQIDEVYDEMTPMLPPGMKFTKMQTSDDFLNASFHNVIETLIIAILLVIIVVYFFLQNFKATLIPSISIIVSLLGTFAVVKLAGFSLNLLTLFALVLAIGTVVDDAIVVVEAVMAKFENGVSDPMQATNEALHEVFSAVISCTLVFMAVFIPVTFMPGTSGSFFTQFGITLASSVGLSCVSALTLCPALCVILMRPTDNLKGFGKLVKKAYDASYNAIAGKYTRSIKSFLKRPALSWIGLVAAIVLMVVFMKITPKALVPQEDQGVIMVNVTLPQGYTIEETNEVLERIAQKANNYEEVENISMVSGYGILSGASSSYGTLFIRLKNWDERKGIEHSLDMIRYRLYMDCEDIKEATVMPFQQPQIPGYGTGNATELVLQNRSDVDEAIFAHDVENFVAKLSERPEIGSAFNDYSAKFPKYTVDVDAAVCTRSGITPSDVLSVLGSFCGGSFISNFNQYGKVYRVVAQASPEYRLNPESLNNMFVKTGDGQMAPLSQFVTLTPKIGSDVVKRFNLFQSITVNVDPAAGYSTGAVQNAIADVFAETMPGSDYGYEYGGMAREEAKTAGSNMTMVIYLICIFLIYLILACLYNSWFVPFAVLFSVPFGLMGAFAVTAPLAKLGFTNNIYLQTGVIMLIGLLSKTAILITEFAGEKRKHGMSIYDAAFEACKDRLRPILMTVATMIIGMIPLIIESGAGAMGNRSLAIGVVGGMLVGTIALLFVVPVFFMFFQKLHERFQGENVEPQLETEKSE